jgi:glycosyltransferase involved in cell wall biosynthesis
MPGVPTAIIPNGIDVPSAIAAHQSNSELRFLYLGRLHPIKGLDALIDACHILEQRGGIRPWRVTVAGGGSPGYERELHEEVTRRRLADRIRFVGEVVREEKSRLLQETDVLIVPSRAESFGMVVAEALAHGIPVIASKQPPWRELETQDCGLWTDDSPEALAMSMRRISGMPLTEMGAKGRLWMREKFDWHMMTAKMAATYRGLVGNPR